MTCDAKLTPAQQAFAARVPKTAHRHYFVLKVNYNRDKDVAFRAMRKLGWHGYYTGGEMYLWRHDETFLETASRKFFFSEWGKFTRLPKWAQQHAESAEKLSWLAAKFPEFNAHFIEGRTAYESFV